MPSIARALLYYGYFSCSFYFQPPAHLHPPQTANKKTIRGNVTNLVDF